MSPFARCAPPALAVLTAFVLAAGAAAKTTPSTTYLDKSGGYAIAIPTAWKLVPRSLPAIKAMAAQLKKSRQAALASTFSSIAASPAGKNGVKAYRLQAFAWPQNGSTPLLTQVSVGIIKTTKVYGPSALSAIGAQFASSIAANKGSKVTVPKRVDLPAGPAAFIEGAIPAGGGLSNGIELYLIPHGKRIYELSFETDARALTQATLFTSIAEHFKLL